MEAPRVQSKAGEALNSHAGEPIVAEAPVQPFTRTAPSTYGPLPVLTDALSGVDGIEQAFIYGSWAARYTDEVGLVPGDVLVIGDADPDDLDDRARAAERVLRREVNVRRMRRSAWERGQDAFVATVRSRPLVELRLTMPVY